jgi:hypothetical protein
MRSLVNGGDSIFTFKSLAFESLVNLNLCHYVVANSDNHVLLSTTLINMMRNVDLRRETAVIDCLGSLVCSVRLTTFLHQSINRITSFDKFASAAEAIR